MKVLQERQLLRFDDLRKQKRRPRLQVNGRRVDLIRLLLHPSSLPLRQQSKKDAEQERRSRLRDAASRARCVDCSGTVHLFNTSNSMRAAKRCRPCNRKKSGREVVPVAVINIDKMLDRVNANPLKPVKCCIGRQRRRTKRARTITSFYSPCEPLNSNKQ